MPKGRGANVQPANPYLAVRCEDDFEHLALHAWPATAAAAAMGDEGRLAAARQWARHRPA